jgi:hypothetical protein
MTTVCPAHKARGARLTELATTVTRAIKVGSTSRRNVKHFISVADVREEHDDMRDGSVSSPPQEFAGGFVDLLLGRGARYRR